jgi:hypothetical protein
MATTYSKMLIQVVSTSLPNDLATYAVVYEEQQSHREIYPVDIDCYAPTGEDRHLCDQKLSEDSLKLFQIAGGGINVLWSTRDDGGAPNTAILFKRA